jgi:hypothetical protein
MQLYISSQSYNKWQNLRNLVVFHHRLCSPSLPTPSLLFLTLLRGQENSMPEDKTPSSSPISHHKSQIQNPDCCTSPKPFGHVGRNLAPSRKLFNGGGCDDTLLLTSNVEPQNMEYVGDAIKYTIIPKARKNNFFLPSLNSLRSSGDIQSSFHPFLPLYFFLSSSNDDDHPNRWTQIVIHNTCNVLQHLGVVS